MSPKSAVEKRIKEIHRNTRRKYSAEEKIRIVLEGLRGVNVISNYKYMGIYGYYYAAVSTLINMLLLFGLLIFSIYKNRGALYQT